MADEQKAPEGQERTFTQDQVDNIVKERLSRTKEQFKDYDDLKKFRDESLAKQNEITQKQLEEQRQYDEAKKTLLKNVTDLQEKISQKDLQITDMKISTALSGEVSRQNGYVEESMALIKSNAVIDATTGEVRIKGKDSNGIDTLLTVEQGVKAFLTSRPHLVKVAARNGGGTPPGGGNGNDNNGASDLGKLNDEFAIAIQSGNHKRAGELNKQIKALVAAKRSGA